MLASTIVDAYGQLEILSTCAVLTLHPHLAMAWAPTGDSIAHATIRDLVRKFALAACKDSARTVCYVMGTGHEAIDVVRDLAPGCFDAEQKPIDYNHAAIRGPGPGVVGEMVREPVARPPIGAMSRTLTRAVLLLSEQLAVDLPAPVIVEEVARVGDRPAVRSRIQVDVTLTDDLILDLETRVARLLAVDDSDRTRRG